MVSLWGQLVLFLQTYVSIKFFSSNLPAVSVLENYYIIEAFEMETLEI